MLVIRLSIFPQHPLCITDLCIFLELKPARFIIRVGYMVGLAAKTIWLWEHCFNVAYWLQSFVWGHLYRALFHKLLGIREVQQNIYNVICLDRWRIRRSFSVPAFCSAPVIVHTVLESYALFA